MSKKKAPAEPELERLTIELEIAGNQLVSVRYGEGKKEPVGLHCEAIRVTVFTVIGGRECWLVSEDIKLPGGRRKEDAMSKKKAPAEPELKRQLRQMFFLLDQKNREIRVAGIVNFLLGGVAGAIIAQMMLKIL